MFMFSYKHSENGVIVNATINGVLVCTIGPFSTQEKAEEVVENLLNGDLEGDYV